MCSTWGLNTDLPKLEAQLICYALIGDQGEGKAWGLRQITIMKTLGPILGHDESLEDTKVIFGRESPQGE